MDNAMYNCDWCSAPARFKREMKKKKGKSYIGLSRFYYACPAHGDTMAKSLPSSHNVELPRIDGKGNQIKFKKMRLSNASS